MSRFRHRRVLHGACQSIEFAFAELGKFFALGKSVVVCLDGTAYRIAEEE